MAKGRALIIGASGQLGRELVGALCDWVVVAPPRSTVDISDAREVHAYVHATKPDVVFNCAAFNLVDRAEDDLEEAFRTNTYGVRTLADVCRDLDIPLVHVSTNYVFDGKAERPYEETDLPNPINVYGVSKLAGEYFVRNSSERHLIIRTSGLYGIGGMKRRSVNFVETILRQASSGAPLRVVKDQVCSPSNAKDVAMRIVEIVQGEHWGTYHVTNSGACSWYEFAQAILKIAGKSNEIQPVTSEEFGARARRPRNGVLANAATERLGLPPLRPWEEALADYIREREAVNP